MERSAGFLVRTAGVIFALQGALGLAAQAASPSPAQKAAPPLEQPAVQGAVSAQEAVLRRRVEDLYVLMQLGRWQEAEAYIAPGSLEYFRKQDRSGFLGFQVDSIKMDPNGEKASVTVHVEKVIPQLSANPVSMPQTSNWTLTNNLWCLVVPDPTKVFDSAKSHPSPHTEELKFKGHRYVMGKIDPGQIKVARFPFTNVTDHSVTLSSVVTGCPCLEAKMEKKQFKPGESGEIAITFNPAGYERDYAQTVVVKTDPGDLTTYLMVVGYVMPRPLQGRKPQPGSKPGS